MNRGFDEAVTAILAGEAEAHQLLVLLANENDRDGFALKPLPWEGAGEYQHVSYADGRRGFVRVPNESPTSLQDAVRRRRRAPAPRRT